MRILLQLALVLVLGFAAPMRAGDVIDGVVATVNGTAILQSDVENAMRYEAMLEGRRIEELTVADQAATLQRLIDQELLRQEMGKGFPGPTPAEIAARLRKVREQIPGTQSEEGWSAALRTYGIGEPEIAERIALQMQVTRYIEQRLRPSIHVDDASVQAYYKDNLLPQLKASGVQDEPALQQVKSRIEEILFQQRMDAQLSAWLGSLREQARIHTEAEEAPKAKISTGKSATGSAQAMR